VERRIDDGYAAFHWSHHPAADWTANEYVQWLGEQGTSFTTAPFRGSRYVRSGMCSEYHQTTWCAEKAIRFIEANAEGDRPWFFTVNIYDPHHPFDPPPSHLERYLDLLDEIPVPNYTQGELDGKPLFQQIDHCGAYNQAGSFPYDEMTEADHRLLRAAYWAMVDLIDEQVGRMLEALERTGQRDNTLVIFTSDHGEMLGDHGIYLKGPYFYEPAIHVPLIVAGPGVARGVRSRALVELMDLAPTLMDAAGLSRHPGMQARSLWPLLTAERDPHTLHEDVYCEYYSAMPWHRDPAPHLTMLRTGQYKLVAAHGLGTGELYDLAADPAETHNQWDNRLYLQVKCAMLARLCDRMAWTVDPLPLRQSSW
jgi:arylsulfatase A-like enzyme